MKRTISHSGAIASLAAILLAPLASAQTSADALPQDLLDCADEQDLLQRLACYDREIAELEATPAAAAATDPDSVPSLHADGEASVKREVAPEAAQAAPVAATAAAAAEEPAAISATVIEIRQRPRGEMIILLDNEQIWEQKHADTRFRLSVGDTATIKKSAFGGYRLFGDGNRSIQVERTQ